MRNALALGLAAALAASTHAANIYILSSGDPATDAAAALALTSRGHSVTIGVEFTGFDGSQSLAAFQTVYLQANYNWSAGLMPASGQQALIAWVNSGGRLVTSEWVVYDSGPGGAFDQLAAILPIIPDTSFGGNSETMFARVTGNPLNAGLPGKFNFPLTNYAGTEIYSVARPGATRYYASDNSLGAGVPGQGYVGLAGWAIGQGFVFSFSSTCGPEQLGNPNFGQLFSNTMTATTAGDCYANCDYSSVSPKLNVADFACFLSRFAAGDPYANCDQSLTPPVLNIADFSCYLQSFAAGCP